MANKPNQDKPILANLFIGFIKLLSCFSLKNQQRIGAFIGWVFSLFPNYNREVIRANLAVAYPNLSKQELKILANKTLQENAKSFTELGAVWEWGVDKQLPMIKKIYGEYLLDAAYEKGNGVLMLSPHFGNWEVLGFYLKTKGTFTVLYQPPAIKSIENYLNKVRGRVGRPVPTDIAGVKTMFKVLKQNKMVAILPDQDPGKSGGIHAPFFGHPARTMTLVSKLANKTKAEVLYIIGERLPSGEGFAVHILSAVGEISSKDELIATTSLNKGVEKCVAINPSQYLWSYKRYRHPPKGVADIY
jgi:KDO2-lipid IV(A) lauroyltransferase